MKKSFKKWLAPVIVAVIAIVAVVVLFATGVIGGNKVEVPDILNISVEEAQKTLEEAGLSLSITEKEINNEVDENTVLRQSPVSGEKIEKGGIVNVTVSKKSVKVSIPDVENFDKELAIETLQNAGFIVEIVEEESDKYADGAVISQSQTGKGETGSTIVITISKNDNSATDKTVKVPSVEGKTVEEAKKLLGDKLYIKIVEEKFSTSVEKGLIISQTPVKDVEVKEKTIVEVSVSKGKASEAKIVMPDVVFSSRSNAIETLENMGLRVKIANEYDNVISAGVVISQSVPAGTEITADTVVTIVISAGKKPEITTMRPEDIPSLITKPSKTETTKKNETTKHTTTPSTTKKPVVDTEESKYVADFRITTDKAEAKAGDIITVSVKLKTNYKIVSVSLPVIYDARVFEVVGADESNVSSFLNFSGTLVQNGYGTNGNWKSPDSMYSKNSNSEHWDTSSMKTRYKFAFATWVAMPSQGTVITSLDSEETIVTFKLKVKSGVKDTSGRIFLSQDFIKTASDPQGILSVGRAKSDKITTDSIVATGQTINLREATALVVIK